MKRAVEQFEPARNFSTVGAAGPSAMPVWGIALRPRRAFAWLERDHPRTATRYDW